MTAPETRRRPGPSRGAILGLGLAVAWAAIVAAPWAVGADTTRGGLPAALYRDLGLSSPVAPFEAPAFSLPDLGGKPVRLADFQGRAVLLYFWTTW